MFIAPCLTAGIVVFLISHFLNVMLSRGVEENQE